MFQSQEPLVFCMLALSSQTKNICLALDVDQGDGS